jgi:hypothetical protein
VLLSHLLLLQLSKQNCSFGSSVEEEEKRCITYYRLIMERKLSTCYPDFKMLIRALRTIPLSTRSSLIKICQAQYQFVQDSDSSLRRLFSSMPPVTIELDFNRWCTIPIIDVFPQLGVNVQCPLQSAIALDIIRSAPVSLEEQKEFITKGWNTEIALLQSSRPTQIDFSPLFDGSPRPIHHTFPYNPKSSYIISQIFHRYRERLIHHTPTYYSRFTHKNMSRDTRREFCEKFGTDLPSRIWPIFGQDDWIRVYHEHGVQLGGAVEMRQKWYPSGAKPRTYFAMGGSTYKDSRFLQDFFTELVDLFSSTNHVTRLRPERLFRDPDVNEWFLIYDMTSFTSNMVEQKSFMVELAGFFRGVPVIIVDERYGPMEVDLGELLDQYILSCVIEPEVSLERVPEDLRVFSDPVPHSLASMLGIFGNLMTCTLAHFLILSPLVDSLERINVAGDDGLVPVLGGEEDFVEHVISFVGECAPEKTMKTSEEGPVHLKRPISEIGASFALGRNYVPPNVATAVAFLSGSDVDSRYQHMNIEGMSVGDRVSVVGKDLSRFLRSVHSHFDESPVPLSIVFNVYRGFCAIVNSILGFRPSHAHFNRKVDSYIWPVDPASYDFLSADPVLVWCYCAVPDITVVHSREYVDHSKLSEFDVGDTFRQNSRKGLVLLETLGYIEKEKETYHVDQATAIAFFYNLIVNPRTLAPPVYVYSVVRSIPVDLMSL